MKLNITDTTNSDLRNGYVNIVSGPVQDKSIHEGLEIVKWDYANLDGLVDDNSIDEIVFNPLLNRDPQQVVAALQSWHKKLKQKGVLKLSYVDIRRVGLGLHTGNLPLEEGHKLIFGDGFKCILDYQLMKKMADSLGYKVALVSPAEYITSLELEKK